MPLAPSGATTSPGPGPPAAPPAWVPKVERGEPPRPAPPGVQRLRLLQSEAHPDRDRDHVRVAALGIDGDVAALDKEVRIGAGLELDAAAAAERDLGVGGGA